MPTRRKPRSFLWDPSLFGRTDQPKWRDVPREESVPFIEAVIQHEVSLAVLHEIEIRGTSLEAVAPLTSDSPDYLRRRLHGEVRTELRHYMAWAIEFGVHILSPRLAPQDLVEMFPKAAEQAQLRLA